MFLCLELTEIYKIVKVTESRFGLVPELEQPKCVILDVGVNWKVFIFLVFFFWKHFWHIDLCHSSLSYHGYMLVDDVTTKMLVFCTFTPHFTLLHYIEWCLRLIFYYFVSLFGCLSCNVKSVLIICLFPFKSKIYCLTCIRCHIRSYRPHLNCMEVYLCLYF